VGMSYREGQGDVNMKISIFFGLTALSE